ncbi:MAG: hypothetical protein APG08_01282 [Candidatus Methanofastidiosum methylothiophilum]|uniref:DUF883 domain-containing protein n=1 Tax=Candidatus Methanofastidiosum methylothiophilum TaxID=1705564 RepID=A0A150JFH5_9EURY|nr:MAG: hypothetical protein AN188_00782 [Candidatus Methanofastidiosum methylthiophilus]OQC50589.1 MAG: hypothetical protein BWX56_01317 [Euryarchaeota archaeon ADurb.Bin023]HNV94447.1 hypothetical protein [Methanofastidiosum sp.]KYC55993.1 MAG: hypothetical protein APG08_01282 [Candidatus Methanofastidiosum methylthiophilus]KYC58562.1 MAG: hypothetical protein APG09_00034 [Candidatus Methanofastidiosum methylthiophilus]
MKQVSVDDIQKEIERDIEMGKKMIDEGKRLLEEGKYKLDESKSRIKDLGDEAGIKLKEFEEKYSDEIDYVVKESEKALQETEIFIRKYPLMSIFAAFGFGYLIGKLLRK